MLSQPAVFSNPTMSMKSRAVIWKLWVNLLQVSRHLLQVVSNNAAFLLREPPVARGPQHLLDPLIRLRGVGRLEGEQLGGGE